MLTTPVRFVREHTAWARMWFSIRFNLLVPACPSTYRNFRLISLVAGCSNGSAAAPALPISMFTPTSPRNCNQVSSFLQSRRRDRLRHYRGGRDSREHAGGTFQAIRLRLLSLCVYVRPRRPRNLSGCRAAREALRYLPWRGRREV